MSEKKDLFSKIFIGEEVEFIMKISFKVHEQSDEGIISQENPLAVRGFVLDVDDENIYLGNTADAITRFVRRDSIAGGDIVNDQLDDLLNNFQGSSN